MNKKPDYAFHIKAFLTYHLLIYIVAGDLLFPLPNAYIGTWWSPNLSCFKWIEDNIGKARCVLSLQGAAGSSMVHSTRIPSDLYLYLYHYRHTSKHRGANLRPGSHIVSLLLATLFCTQGDHTQCYSYNCSSC